MKPDQAKYAKARIQYVLAAYEERQKEKFNTSTKSFTDAEKLRMIREEEVSLLWPHSKLKPSMTLLEAFDYGQIERTAFDKAAFNKAMRPVRKEAAAVIDQIVLGETEAAIKLVDLFIKNYDNA